MDEATITADRLEKTFRTRRRKVTAVADLTLSVVPGETFGLIGPDGAGKTTATRVILGLLRRSGGRSSVLGYDSMRRPYAIRERVGYIAQQFALPADLSVMENMRFFAQVQGVSRADQKRRIPDLLTFAGLNAFERRPAGRLSGGMKKKLALACSLVHAPRVLLLDEPTLGVDPVSRREFWNMLGDLRAEQGLTVFVCTPYMDEADRCSRVGLLYEGRLVACDTPGAIRRQVAGQMVALRPAQPAAARAALAKLEGVREVQSYGRALHVFVDEPARRIPEIDAALASLGIGHEGVRVAETRMEEAFTHLIQKLEAGTRPSVNGGPGAPAVNESGRHE